jgi:hypothetical protein
MTQLRPQQPIIIQDRQFDISRQYIILTNS